MHEVGIMRSAIGIAEEHARRNGATRIHLIALRTGRQSGVVPEALELAFQALSPGTMAEGAELELDTVEVVCDCHYCRHEFTPEGPFYMCPQCGRLSTDVRRGREIEVATLDVS